MPLIEESQIVVSTVTEDAKGRPREPEEHEAARKMIVSGVGVSFGGVHTGEAITTTVVADGVAAGEVAANLQTACRFCEHYDHQGALNVIYKYSHGDFEQQKMITKLRHVLSADDGPDELIARNDTELFEHTGLCRAMTDIKKQPVLTHATGCCPKEIHFPTQTDLSKLFKIRDPRAARAAGQVKDDVMRAAGAAPKMFFKGSDLPTSKREDAAITEIPSTYAERLAGEGHSTGFASALETPDAE